MPETAATNGVRSGAATDHERQAPSSAHATLEAQIDRLLAAARPRLLRLVRSYGVAADEADDAVQETLVTAWQRLRSLRAPERFDAWLDGICYHMCQHQMRRERIVARREVRWPNLPTDDAPRGDVQADPPDAREFDPTEELHRQDLEMLLDRALGYLPRNMRELLELCYLANLPQREAATQLRMTVSALESRLHRARRELRRLLSGVLRADAEALGLALDEDTSAGWRETREWCNFCGSRRLRGIFQPLSSGHVNFRLRCPECSRRFGCDLYSTGGVVPLAGVRSFRPAYKRLVQLLKRYYTQDYARALVNGWQTCPGCTAPVPTGLVSPGGSIAAFPDQFRLALDCPRCGPIVSPAAFAAYWTDAPGPPLALQFIEEHPRWMIEPDVLAEHIGQPAVRFRLVDLASAAQLTILADARTLRIVTWLDE